MKTLCSLLVITATEPPTWKSCEHISRNLHQAYLMLLQEVFPNSSFFDQYFLRLPEDNHTKIVKLALEIYQKKPDRLVFVDHLPHPKKLLVALDQIYEGSILPEIYVYIYGNLTIYAGPWHEIEAILKKAKIRFICASNRQANLLRKLIKSSSSSITVCPFPVNTDTFFHSLEARNTMRRRFSIGNDEFVLLYTGRMSIQKNITQLVREVTHLANSSSLKLRLILAGKFDDLGIPMFKKSKLASESFFEFQQLLEGIPKQLQYRIQYLGDLSAMELNQLYNGADLFVSLSLHHDEDYGMSPAEALCCGLPVLLTNWGGFSDFSSRMNNEQYCQLIPVALASDGLEISYPALHKMIEFKASKGPLLSSRAHIANLAKTFYSISSTVENLKELHHKKGEPFSGFSSLMKTLANLTRRQVIFPKGPRKGTFYEQIYSTYLRDSANERMV